MTNIEIILPITDVQTIHTEFFWWKRHMKNDNPLVSIEKRYPQLSYFITICNITLQITPKHEYYKFSFTEIEAQALIVDIKYMVDTPYTLQALQAKLHTRLAPKIKL